MRNMSHPSRVRGLKLVFGICSVLQASVAPLTGAWIETVDTEYLINTLLVAPLTGAWIETLLSGFEGDGVEGRTPHGCVD